MRKLFFASLPFVYLLLLLFQKDLAMVGDLGRHLKLGEIVVNCLCVPQTNLFSYTHPGFPIVNHEWLAEVIFYLTSLWFGLNGLLILKMILVIASASLLYHVALKKGSLFWVTLFSFLSITLFSMRFFVLPELFSYFFISLFIFILEKYKNSHLERSERSRSLYLLFLLPLFEILWVNMHIYFILGIAIYGFFLLETMLQTKKLDKKILLIGAILIFVTLINPSGIRGALLPLTFTHNYGFGVEENGSPFAVLTPNSTNSNLAYTLVLQIIVFEFLAGLFAVGLFFKEQWKQTFHFGNGILAVLLGLKFTRCISLFGLFGFIPFVQLFTMLEEKIKTKIDASMQNSIKTILVILVGIVVVIHVKGIFEYKIASFSFVPSAENASVFIKQAHVHGKIFNNYVVGNYLIYALYPQEKVYVDARPEAYPASFFAEYWQMMADETFFNEQVKKYNINAVVFNVALEDPTKSRPFLLRLLNSTDWVPVYGDGTITIFVRNNEVNKDVIEKYAIPVQRH